jgi:hypothetical protein
MVNIGVKWHSLKKADLKSFGTKNTGWKSAVKKITT